MIHKNQRPHGCDICKKRFKALSTLNAHLLLHTGKKPHGCNMCKKQFRQISTLKKCAAGPHKRPPAWMHSLQEEFRPKVQPHESYAEA